MEIYLWGSVMSENISFRSSLNGFNRNDVIDFIDRILKEKSELEVLMAVKEKQLSDNEECVNQLKKENAEYMLRKAEFEEKLNALSAENEDLRKQLDELNAENDENDKCDECDISKVYEARLGAAMLDAKRFSEILVKEANDKSSELFSNAYAMASDTREKAAQISKSIADINNQFNMSFKVLLDNMSSLGKNLDAFTKGVKLNENSFDFSTHFAKVEKKAAGVDVTQTLKTDNSFLFSNHQDLVSTDVNFDDADEFDFRVNI